MEFTFTAPVIEWRGPAPFYFIPAPAKISPEIKEIASNKSYGWGVLHARVEIKGQSWKTALFPKDGLYLVPLKNAYRLPLNLEVGQRLKVKLKFDSHSE